MARATTVEDVVGAVLPAGFRVVQIPDAAGWGRVFRIVSDCNVVVGEFSGNEPDFFEWMRNPRALAAALVRRARCAPPRPQARSAVDL